MGEGCGIQHTHGGELFRKASVFRVSEWLGDKPEVTTLLEERMSSIEEDSDDTDDEADEEGGMVKGSVRLERRVSTTTSVNCFLRRHSTVRSVPLPATNEGTLGSRRVVATAASSPKVGMNSGSRTLEQYPDAGKDGKGKRASSSSSVGLVTNPGGGGGHPENTFKFKTVLGRVQSQNRNRRVCFFFFVQCGAG